MDFGFATAGRIIFGLYSYTKIADYVSEFGDSVFMVSGGSYSRVEPLVTELQKRSIKVTRTGVQGEPTVELIEDILTQLRDLKPDVVLGAGGGSVIDTGKALAALATHPGRVLDYLEVIGGGKKLQHAPLPYIAIPTTAGTGSEVTKNAVLKSQKHKVKVSLRHNWMIPDIALVDPVLTLTVPKNVTASTGMDALTQLIEPYVSHKANPLTDGICKEGLLRAAGSLRNVYLNGDDLQAREDMCVASLFGGLALANSKLGAVHGFAGPVGGYLDAPHGMICARLLPLVTRMNIEAVKNDPSLKEVMLRYDDIAEILTGDSHARAADVPDWLHDLTNDLQIGGLAEFGLQKNDIPKLVKQSQKSSSMQGNPVKLNETQLTEILTQAIES
ncbi:MAG: iron-containing alcohol dehydrogenase [candidate division KSB1 bacterium]|nr:iron-containing alcohol dehydrogenase [candidate division KSB1 bacterium]